LTKNPQQLSQDKTLPLENSKISTAVYSDGSFTSVRDVMFGPMQKEMATDSRYYSTTVSRSQRTRIIRGWSTLEL
jgi:hypothetical protein